MKISKEGEKFLIDTKVYLITKGIKERRCGRFSRRCRASFNRKVKKGKDSK